MAYDTPETKAKLRIGIEVLQKYGRDGTIIADLLLKETPADSPGFDKQKLFAEIESRLRQKS